MKNIIIAVISVVLALSIIFLIYFMPNSEQEGQNIEEVDPAVTASIAELEKQIDANIEVKTYKNTLVLYEKLIELEPKNIEWYVGLAESYQHMGLLNKHKSMCKKIIRTFPDEKEGYLMLIKYYALKENERYVISTYNSAPEHIQTDDDFLSVYEDFEWSYRLRGGALPSVGMYSGGKYVYQRNGKYGYRNSNLYSGISAKFTVARPFIEDKAAVQLDGEWYFIDTSGYRVLASNDMNFQDLYSFSEGYAVAKIDGVYGYIDSSFKKYSFNYEDATSFMNGIAAVKKDGKWALINKNFKRITGFIFDDVVRDEANICSRNSVVFCSSNGSYCMVNALGRKVTSETFDAAKPFYADYAAVKKDGKWGFVNARGKTVIDFIYDNATSYASDMAAVKVNGKWGCVTKDGKTVLEFEYDHAMVTSDTGVVVVLITEKDNNKIKEATRFVKYYKFS